MKEQWLQTERLPEGSKHVAPRCQRRPDCLQRGELKKELQRAPRVVRGDRGPRAQPAQRGRRSGDRSSGVSGGSRGSPRLREAETLRKEIEVTAETEGLTLACVSFRRPRPRLGRGRAWRRQRQKTGSLPSKLHQVPDLKDLILTG